MRILWVIFSFYAAPLHASPSEDLARIQDTLSTKQQQEQALKAKQSKTESELKDLREKLVAATDEEKTSHERLLSLQAKLDQLQTQENAQKQALAEQQGKLSGVLTAMLRLSRTPPEVLMLRPDAPVDNIRSAILLKQAMPYYAEKAQGLSANLDMLRQTRLDIIDKRNELIEAQHSFTSREEKLNALLNERQEWLTSTESERTDIRAQIDALSAQAKTVQELLNRVVAAPMPKKSFGKKGTLVLSLPVKGRLIYGFNQPDDVGSESRGLMLAAHSGDIIVAPADGQVVFAGPFKGYGNILILRHNDDYHSFLAGFGRVDATVGQVVNAGEPLGRAEVSDKGGSAQVYFELRYHGSPVDPMRKLSPTTLAANRP